MGLRSKSGTPLGGTLAQVFNAELSYEIISNLEFAIFADAGNLSRDDDNPTAFPSDLSYAVGAGLRYKLPVGPLRIDYGYNPDRREGEPSGALHITFGFAF
jgi:outer membrane translocation and assembly module TamA